MLQIMAPLQLVNPGTTTPFQNDLLTVAVDLHGRRLGSQKIGQKQKYCDP
jgi:hypothetical protein